MQETDEDIDARPVPVDLDETRLEPEAPAPRRRRRVSRFTAMLVAVLVIVSAAVALLGAVRFGVLPASLLPAAIRSLVFPAQEPRPTRPAVPVDPIRALPDAQRRALFDPMADTTLRFARSPYVDVSVMCTVMNVAGLEGAVWAPDPVIPAEWTCFTGVLEVKGPEGEPASTVFGLIRGRNRGVADVIRVSVVEGGPGSAAAARQQGVTVIRSILEVARLQAPPGFVEAALGGTAFLSESFDWRFQVNRPDGVPRLDLVLLAKAQPGLIPSDWFSGRVMRLPGDPIPGNAGAVPGGLEDLRGSETDEDPGDLDLPPGFVADDPDAGAGVTVPEFEPLPDPGGEAVDGEAPIENLAR
jgi:hypothetical protein